MNPSQSISLSVILLLLDCTSPLIGQFTGRYSTEQIIKFEGSPLLLDSKIYR